MAVRSKADLGENKILTQKTEPSKQTNQDEWADWCSRSRPLMIFCSVQTGCRFQSDVNSVNYSGPYRLHQRSCLGTWCDHGPFCLPSGLRSLHTDTAFGLLGTIVKTLPSGILFDSGRHVSLWSVPCFDVAQSATFSGGPVCTLFGPLCLLYCEDTAHFQQV